MLVGYARLPTEDQTSTLQFDTLKAAGCERTVENHGISVAVHARAGLDEALTSLHG
jgi:DNA invertase Pin-like site-specific DNA recombinase